jgi:hypothetical protein
MHKVVTYGSTDTVSLVGAVLNSVVALRDAVVVVCAANHCEGKYSIDVM